MDPNILAGEIMRHVGRHKATDSSAYLEDITLAQEIGVSLADVQ